MNESAFTETLTKLNPPPPNYVIWILLGVVVCGLVLIGVWRYYKTY